MSTASINQNLVSVKDMDFLDQDPPLRGQNFVCLSFISPEEVIKKKDCYFFEQFMKDITVDMNDFFDKLTEKYAEDAGTLKTIKERYSYLFDKEHIVDEYNFFINKQGAALEEEYFKQNNFQTSIRGLKVRGVFDTLREAEIRSQVLKKLDDKFNVYVAQVGCWCPWSPNPEDIEQQEYAETQLNTMMKHYKDNQDKKDVFYQERKRDLQFAQTKTKIEEEDAWLANKEASTSGTQETSSDSQIDSQIDSPINGVVTEEVVPPPVASVVEEGLVPPVASVEEVIPPPVAVDNVIEDVVPPPVAAEDINQVSVEEGSHV